MQPKLTKLEWLKAALAEHHAQFGHLPPKEQPCLLWPWSTQGSHSGKRYAQVWTGKRTERGHRVAYNLYNDFTIPNNLLGCHTCDESLCVNDAHVFIGTSQDNSKDMGAKGRQHLQRHPEHARGKNNKNTKLSTDDIPTIRKMFDAGITLSIIARKYNLNTGTIYDVVHRNTWSYVD